ncbi:MAG: DUF1801 domain-containing protein [Bacteroidetes bacterium]|nr:DUF1801 domain-containing protein [Bacteroidota bacterium]
MKTFANINEYVLSFPKETQMLLEQMRMTIQKAAPNATESMKYGMPTFELMGNLVHFAAYKHHIGFYPAPSGIVAFKDELKTYVTSKGAIQFPIDKKLPLALVTKITKFRVKESLEKAKLKKNYRVCENGHSFLKSSDCPVCPQCEKEKKPLTGFISLLAAPARRALENAGIKTLSQLAKLSEAEVLALHGMGISSLPILQKALKEKGLTFKK